MTGHRRWLGALLAAALLAVLVSTTSSTPSVDAASASLQGWRIATSGEPWLEDVDLDATPYDYDSPPYWTGPSKHGHEVVFRSPGITAASVPAYLGSGSDPADFRIRPAGVVAAVLVWLAVLLVFGALRPRLGSRLAGGVAAVLALGTPLWSVAADAMWPHTLTVLGLAGMAWAASRDRWLLAGVLGGIGLTGRLHLSLAVAVLGTGVGLARRSWRPVVLVAAGSLPFLFLAAAWSRWLYGEWDPAGGYPQADAYAERATSQSLFGTLANEAGLWVSLDRGFLVWTPVALLLLPALLRSWRHQPDWARVLVVGGLLYTAVQGLMNHFAGGSAFYGYRLTLELLLSLAPALALAIPHAGRLARAALPFVAGLQVGATAVGAVFDSPGLPLERAWTGNAFLEILDGAPALVVPWVLCGVLGVLAARVLADDSAEPETTSTTEGAASAPEQTHQRG